VRRANPHQLEIGEPRWRAIVRLLIWLSVVSIYYVSLEKVDALDTSLSHNTLMFWGSLLFPLFLTPYLIGIISRITKREALVVDEATGVLRKNGKSIIRLDQITEVRLKAVNGICEEFSLSVRGKDNISIELPVDGSTDGVTGAASAIAAMANVKVLLVR